MTAGSLKEACRRRLSDAHHDLEYYSLPQLSAEAGVQLQSIPFCLRILLENALRHCDEDGRTDDQVLSLARWHSGGARAMETRLYPSRVLMQDYTGIPALVDLAAMRDAMQRRGKPYRLIDPTLPVDLVIDHSLVVDRAGDPESLSINLAHEYRRNAERYRFVKWAGQAFRNLRIVPPGKGILHQINVEYLAKIVQIETHGNRAIACPDTLVGTDSHTTMANGIGVLGWGVGGIEAVAVMLGLPVTVSLKDVIGVRLVGSLPGGSSAADLVLALTKVLRTHGVVDKLVEFCGPSVQQLTGADRATIANMAPEFGSTCAYFPIDATTLQYLHQTGRSTAHVELVETYAKAQELWCDGTQDPQYRSIVEFDLGGVFACAAGPRRPQESQALTEIPKRFEARTSRPAVRADELRDGAVVLAAITSCTTTSNPGMMIAAGLLAKKAVERGLSVKPWVKTSFSPGSRVVASYLEAAGLQTYLNVLKFNVVGFGCATCDGNSGRLANSVEETIERDKLEACAVLSGNRNFEGRIHPLVRASYLMSPALVIAYALAGSMTIDITAAPIGCDPIGKAVSLAELWPAAGEIEAALSSYLTPDLYRSHYAEMSEGDLDWRSIRHPEGALFPWDPQSTYLRPPPYANEMAQSPQRHVAIRNARALLVLGDDITTDHISPVGAIGANSIAGRFLSEKGVRAADLYSYGARRSNHEVMVRGSFANDRLRNEMLPDREGPVTRHFPSGEIMPLYDAAIRYMIEAVPLIVVAGKAYGTGSSRDWAAKGPHLLGVKAVLAEGFERIHRANLVNMGILPLEFPQGTDRATLGLCGPERFDIFASEDQLSRGEVNLGITYPDGTIRSLAMACAMSSRKDIEIWRAGGVVPYMLARIEAVA